MHWNQKFIPIISFSKLTEKRFYEQTNDNYRLVLLLLQCGLLIFSITGFSWIVSSPVGPLGGKGRFFMTLKYICTVPLPPQNNWLPTCKDKRFTRHNLHLSQLQQFPFTALELEDVFVNSWSNSSTRCYINDNFFTKELWPLIPPQLYKWERYKIAEMLLYLGILLTLINIVTTSLYNRRFWKTLLPMLKKANLLSLQLCYSVQTITSVQDGFLVVVLTLGIIAADQHFRPTRMLLSTNTLHFTLGEAYYAAFLSLTGSVITTFLSFSQLIAIQDLTVFVLTMQRVH